MSSKPARPSPTHGASPGVLALRRALGVLALASVLAGARAAVAEPLHVKDVRLTAPREGAAEIVHSGGPTGADVAINWRIDRIREGDVVFIREDPSHPEIPTATRVLALRTEEEGRNAPRR